MAVTRASVHVSVPVETLLEDLVLGATTFDRGLAQLLPMSRKQRTLNRFFGDGADNITARTATFAAGTPASLTEKDEKQIVLIELQLLDEIDPVEFNTDWEFLWTSGPSATAQINPELQREFTNALSKNFNHTIERILWRGDIGGGGSGGIELVDGWIKLIDADAAVNNAAPLGVVTAANIISVLESLVAATPEEVQELSSPTIMLSHVDKYFYREAARALDFKGTNIQEAISDIFGGFPMISTHGIPAGRLFLLNAGGGDMSELKAGVWADADRFNIAMGKGHDLDDVVGARIRVDLGVNFVYGKQITEYTTV